MKGTVQDETQIISQASVAFADPVPAGDLPPSIVAEIAERRKGFEKHFLMSDGSYTVTTYQEPVHMEVDGAWVEVDNTLILSTKADGVSRYETAGGLADVSFTQDFQSELVTMSQDGYSITWGLTAVSSSSDKLTATTQPLQPVRATVMEADLSQITADEYQTMAVKSTSGIRYSNALAQNVDLDYVVLPSRVKESIILNGPQDIAAYVMDITVENISARLLDSREIEFYNEAGEVIFTMWAPYMYDAAGELSQDIAVEMARKKDGGYLVSIAPDQEWLSDPDRVYPIVIDPDVSASRVRTNIVDNYVLEGSGNQDRNLDRLYIGLRSGHVARAYLRYVELPTLPAGATITSAQQTLYITANTSTANTANAYRVTGGTWESGTITWANKPAANTLVASNISHNNCTRYTFGCTGTVRHWYTNNTNGTYQNYGFMIRYTDETIADYNAFYSADRSTESQRPLLTISYTVPATNISVNIVEDVEFVLIDHTLQLHYTTNPSGLRVGWYSSDPLIATVSDDGVVTGLSDGMVQITLKHYDSDTATHYYDYAYVYVKTSAGICDNTEYYIMNYDSRQFLSLETASDTDQANVSTRTRSSSTLSQWQTEEQSNGQFKLISVYSSTSKVLDATGTNVDIFTDNGASYQRFGIYRITSGIYKGLYQIRYGDYYVTQDTDYNVYLTTTFSASAVWSFMAVEKRGADLFAFNYTYSDNYGNHTFDTTANNFIFNLYFDSLGYDANTFTNSIPSTAYSSLCSNDIFVFYGHGNAGYISFQCEGNEQVGCIFANRMISNSTDHCYINTLEDNQLSLLRCVLYIGCNTGVDYEGYSGICNLVDETYKKGAHFVLGLTEMMYVSHSNIWFRTFLSNAFDEDDIQTACEDADEELGYIDIPINETETKRVYGMPDYCVGDATQFLH